MKVLQSIGAVVLGYVVFAVSAVLLFQLSGLKPHAHQSLGFTIFAVVYGMLFAALGGLLTMRIAPERPALHAAFLSGLIALGAIASLVSSAKSGATWSQWGALVLMAPCAYLASRVRPALAVS